ncbi:MAG: hypothetical protein ACK56I_16860, partial [bacterium]
GRELAVWHRPSATHPPTSPTGSLSAIIHRFAIIAMHNGRPDRGSNATVPACQPRLGVGLPARRRDDR